MTDQTTNEEQEKPTLEMARKYIAKLREITGAMVEERELKDNLTPTDMWKLVHAHLGNTARLIEIAQEQLKRI
ncbi:hypothetical protein [Necropsobacter massiliensis]|uniref:hypothetical protein n=1 Tax=Necropsobacter massiliensis TaxID=1400001 RepID=UPI000595C70D|nr:hypothetical protein [Necropsobacter massiliensis]